MNQKQEAGERAVEFVREGMIVGLGSGSTAYYSTRKIGERVRGGLAIRGVCTSERTRELAVGWEIPVVDIDEVDHIDLTIDGADEVDPSGNGIKGGGGALLLEKIVASRSLQNIWVVEERKMVEKLGAFPLPVEIMAFGHGHLIRTFTGMGFKPELRKEGGEIVITDGGHYLVDLHLGAIEDPAALGARLKEIPGVLEHGLFLGIVNKAVCAGSEATRLINYR